MADWEYIKPTGDSATVNLGIWPASPTTHYDKVIDDDVGTLVNTTWHLDRYDRYVMANSIYRGTDIKKIRLFALGRRNNPLAAGRFSIDSGGVFNATSHVWGALYSPNAQWESWTFKLNPVTAGAWTLAELDALEAGIGHSDTGIPSGVMTFEYFICVIWTEAAVRADAASGYDGSQATLNGTILQNEGNFLSKLTYDTVADQIRVRFNWGVDTSYGTDTAWENLASGSFDADISGLDPALTYHFRAEIQVRDNDQNWESFYSSDKVVNPVAPTVTTQAVSNIAATTATGNGNVTDLGVPDPTQHGHCWSTSPNPTVADDKTELGAKAATGAFTSSLTGLTPGTYYCRAYATNDAGTSYGTQVTFTTIESSTVTTDPATSVEASTSTLNGTLDNDGGEACDCGFEWGETAAYGNTTPTQSRTTGQTFSQAISGLSPNTTYHFRAFSINAAGTSYGADKTFVTEVAMPSVTTDAATGGLVTSAILNGTLDDDGGEACDCGFEWGETVAYGRTTPTQSRTTGQTFSQTITGLDTDTTYHFRAFATNSAGVDYGDDETFATVQAKGRHYALGRHEL